MVIIKLHQTYQHNIQKMQKWPLGTSEVIKQCGYYKRDNIHRRDNENIKKPWRTIENTIRFQSDPTGKVVNLSKKSFSRETFRLLNKNLHFVSAPKVYDNCRLNEEMQIFYRTI